ncbi:ENTH domain-containing [Hyphodiscus hymeniophilus]|uniref:ENTH domain-containing n=1 Tax=Hyphodiscus hymeniophilus TaxID=353542 RepID=A0A9P6VDP6_9HELO|nr:ENTH domain-containing [Hyphodiscus hymeniophilus]
MTVDKGLLREAEAVQHQITALLKCDVLDNEPDNEITITVFRMLVTDLLALFQVMNKAMINILGNFFEMSRPDAERALEIYKNFTKQTDFVVAYLNTAREYQLQTRIEVPKLKHAPINLGKQLEDYLMDPDFEINRRQYLAEQESKKGKTGTNGASKPFPTSTKTDSASRAAAGRAFPDTQPPASKPAQVAKGPDPDLIDFFDSIEQNQQPMASLPQPGYQQQGLPQFNNSTPYQLQTPQFHNGFDSQQTVFQTPPQQFPQQQQPFNTGLPEAQQPQQTQPLQTNFTGAGFGGYTPQPSFQPGGLQSIPQESAATFQQPPTQGAIQTGAQNTNPFRQSIMTQPTGSPGPAFPLSPPITSLTRQSTNPFAKSSPQAVQPFSPPPDQQFQQQQQLQQQAAPVQPTATGTNPFARNIAVNAQPPQTSGGLLPQPTGSTNPFRQSQFVNTATGIGWQNNQQPIGGGLDNLETVPVFPRPAQQQPWQQ